VKRARWKYEFPPDPQGHRGHDVETTAYGHGRHRYIAQLCYSCRVIFKERRLCVAWVATGCRCRRQAIRSGMGDCWCPEHHPTNVIRPSVRSVAPPSRLQRDLVLEVGRESR